MLIQLIYLSQPFGFDTPTLNGILVDARRNNRQDEISGALICRSDIYLQLLEGPCSAIEAAYHRIAADDRHLEIHRLLTTEVTQRLFPNWDMFDDPARSWLWSPREVAAGDVLQASRAELVGVFERVSREAARAANHPADRQYVG